MDGCLQTQVFTCRVKASGHGLYWNKGQPRMGPISGKTII